MDFGGCLHVCLVSVKKGAWDQRITIMDVVTKNKLKGDRILKKGAYFVEIRHI